jgi:plastocyanin
MNPHSIRWALIGWCVLPLATSLAAPVSVNVTGRSGALAEAIVVFDPLDGMPAPSRDTANVDQVNKQFVPRITVVRTGTAISFPNSDNIRHQVYSFSPSKVFTLKLYAGTPAAPVLFDKPGMVVLGCNIHDKMSPWWTLPILPRLTARAMHRLSFQAVTIDCVSGIRASPRKRRPRPSWWPLRRRPSH